jgi:hypothetical protein
MPKLRSNVFGGMQPKAAPDLLPERFAQQATNMKLSSGALEPWLGPLAVGLTLNGATPVRTIYRFGESSSSKTQYWFQFTGDVSVVKGPVAGDTEEKTYWTDGTYPKKTKASLAISAAPYPSASLRMGIPAPTYTPGVTVSGTATDGTVTATNSAYVATYVSSWGEEGPPSLASAVATWRPGQTVTVTLPSAPSGAYSISKVRLYRSATSNSRTGYQFVAEINVGAANYADTALTSTLGEVCTTWDFTPPVDNMQGLVDMGNGILAAYADSTVYFCEPGFPYAWPVKYETAVGAPVVGLGVFGQGLFVGTTKGASVITTVDPASVTEEPVKGADACLSRRSIVSLSGGVAYAGNDGLAWVGPGGYRNLTANLLTREQWQAYAPTSIYGYEFEGRYYAFYDTGTKQGSLIFTFGEEASFVECDEWCSAAYVDLKADSMFVVKSNVLYEWGKGAALTAKWKSKAWRFSGGVSMARGMVEADTYPVRFEYFVDTVSRLVYQVPDRTPFPLPAVRGALIAYQVDTSSRVSTVAVATSTKELGND